MDTEIAQVDPEVTKIDPNLHSPDGEPWCRFGAGSVWCLNAGRCLNPHHRGRVSGDEL